MIKKHTPDRGDVYMIDPESTGREMKNKHRFIVITPKAINELGVVMTVPVTTGGAFSRNNGLTVSIDGYDTTGVAVCHQVRSFDIEDRVRRGCAKYIEKIDAIIMAEIINRVVSIIDPA